MHTCWQKHRCRYFTLTVEVQTHLYLLISCHSDWEFNYKKNSFANPAPFTEMLCPTLINQLNCQRTNKQVTSIQLTGLTIVSTLPSKECCGSWGRGVLALSLLYDALNRVSMAPLCTYKTARWGEVISNYSVSRMLLFRSHSFGPNWLFNVKFIIRQFSAARATSGDGRGVLIFLIAWSRASLPECYQHTNKQGGGGGRTGGHSEHPSNCHQTAELEAAWLAYFGFRIAVRHLSWSEVFAAQLPGGVVGAGLLSLELWRTSLITITILILAQLTLKMIKCGKKWKEKVACCQCGSQ